MVSVAALALVPGRILCTVRREEGVIPTVYGFHDFIDRTFVERPAVCLAVLLQYHGAILSDHWLGNPGIPTLIIFHREEEDHDGEGKLSVAQHFPHAGTKTGACAVGGSCRPTLPQFHAEEPKPFFIFRMHADKQ